MIFRRERIVFLDRALGSVRMLEIPVSYKVSIAGDNYPNSSIVCLPIYQKKVVGRPRKAAAAG